MIQLVAALRLEQRLVHVVAALQAAAIDVVVLKGAAAAHLDRDDPGQRTFGDVDVLVRAADLDRAVAVLKARGCTRKAPARRPALDRRFFKGVTVVEPDGIEIDVHTTLVEGTFGYLIDVDELLRGTTTFTVGGRQLPALDRELRLLHACYHTALASVPPPGTLGDAAVLLGDPLVDRARVVRLAAAWESTGVVTRTVELVGSRLGVTVDEDWRRRLAGHQPTRRAQRALTAYADGRHGPLPRLLSSLWFLDNWRDRMAYLAMWLLPSLAYVQARGGLRHVLRRGLAWTAALVASRSRAGVPVR